MSVRSLLALVLLAGTAAGPLVAQPARQAAPINRDRSADPIASAEWPAYVRINHGRSFVRRVVAWESESAMTFRVTGEPGHQSPCVGRIPLTPAQTLDYSYS